MVISLKSWRPSGRVHGRWGWIHTALVTSLFQWTAAQLSITPGVVTAAVGDTVTLSLRYEGRLIHVFWFRRRGTGAGDVILDVLGSDPPVYGPQSTGRETALGNGSMRITDVQTGDSGTYTAEVNLDPGGLQQATARLRVHAPEAGGNNIRTITPMTVSIPEKAPEAAGNNIQTYTPMIVSVPEKGAPPAADTPGTCWRVPLAVASGMLVSAALVVLGVVLFYERRLKKVNGVAPGGNPSVISEPAVNYENVENGNQVQSAERPPDADPTYMALTHEDQTTYGHLQRLKN